MLKKTITNQRQLNLQKKKKKKTGPNLTQMEVQEKK